MYYIILPQSIKIILPPMVNQIVNLIKNTSCLYIIGGADLISLTYSFVTGENTGGAYAPAYLLSPLQDSQCLGDPSEEKRPAGDISENRRDGDGQ